MASLDSGAADFPQTVFLSEEESSIHRSVIRPRPNQGEEEKGEKGRGRGVYLHLSLMATRPPWSLRPLSPTHLTYYLSSSIPPPPPTTYLSRLVQVTIEGFENSVRIE